MNTPTQQDIPPFGADVDAASFARIRKLAALFQEQTARVELCEEALAQAKAARLRTEREDLPELLRELGIESVVLADGSSVTLKEQVTAAITEAKRPEAHAWLREHGFGGLIKSSVVVAFPAGEEAVARGLAQKLADEIDKDVLVNEAVVPQTLGAFVRERLEAGEAPPAELFGIFTYGVAKITPPRPSRGKR